MGIVLRPIFKYSKFQDFLKDLQESDMWTLFQNCNARQAYLHYFMQNFYSDQRYLQKLSFKTHGNCFCFLFWKKKFGFLQFMTLINPWTTYKHKAIFKCIIWCYKANSFTTNLSDPLLTKRGSVYTAQLLCLMFNGLFKTMTCV